MIKYMTTTTGRANLANSQLSSYQGTERKMLDAADRWSYNPFKKELVCFWWKVVDNDGTGYKAKEWFTGLKFTDFLKIAIRHWKRYRVLWFLDDWQFETGCCLEED